MSYLEWLIVGGGCALLFLILVTVFFEEVCDILPVFLLTALLGAGAVVSLCIFGALKYEEAACEGVSEQMGIETEYHGNTGCWLKINDKWVLEENYRDTTQHPAVLG